MKATKKSTPLSVQKDFDTRTLRGSWAMSKDSSPNSGSLEKRAIKVIRIGNGIETLRVPEIKERLKGELLLGPSVMQALLSDHAASEEESVIERLYRKSGAIKLCFPGADLVDQNGYVHWIYLFRIGFGKWTCNVRWHEQGFDSAFTFVTYNLTK